MRDISSYVFYNFLIRKLEKIKIEIDAKEYGEAQLNAFPLVEEFQNHAWRPFPDYQDLVVKLHMNVIVMFIAREILLLKDGQENDSCNAISAIRVALTYSHLFNALATCYKFDAARQTEKANLIKQGANGLGAFFFEFQKVYNCHGNFTYKSTETNSNKVSLQPQQNYLNIVTLLKSFDNNRLSQFCLDLFESLDPIEKDSDKMSALKGNETNLFTLGEIEHVVTLCNVYKQEFQQALAREQQIKDDAPEFCEIMVPILNQIKKF